MKVHLCPGVTRLFSRKTVQWSILLSEHLPCLHGIAQVGVANVAGLPYLQTSEAAKPAHVLLELTSANSDLHSSSQT